MGTLLDDETTRATLESCHLSDPTGLPAWLIYGRFSALNGNGAPLFSGTRRRISRPKATFDTVTGGRHACPATDGFREEIEGPLQKLNWTSIGILLSHSNCFALLLLLKETAAAARSSKQLVFVMNIRKIENHAAVPSWGNELENPEKTVTALRLAGNNAKLAHYGWIGSCQCSERDRGVVMRECKGVI
ncbi:hypothetical protein DL93DRAFT_2101241 [Clavulina sp. PMI_390]|nr:hypothetical protein DL93DRAFT_2101241 [Clavulina sp. PMI_390]